MKDPERGNLSRVRLNNQFGLWCRSEASMIYVLIVILGGYSSQSGYSNVVAEFNTFEACEAARKSIISSALPPDTRDRVPQLRAHGCHAKGERK